ncbi:hypothetical protein [Gordonia sp. NPDC127522]|uniref:MmyB family transcriptional regulator n=1 Tax=Gordonia sp. NPDC127522 TaxID=3345390 RepID=UPI0036452AD5
MLPPRVPGGRELADVRVPQNRSTQHKKAGISVVGELTLAYEELAVTADPGAVLYIYTAEPGFPSAERLRLLASYAASEVAGFRATSA